MTTMLWNCLLTLSVIIFFSGVSIAFPNYAEENYGEKYKSNFSSNGSETPWSILQIARDSLSLYFLKRDVSPPSYECSDDVNCSFTDIDLICGEENTCTCEPSKCWHYELALEDRYLNYIFTCDDCGLLGSQCSKNGTCDAPGYCGQDFFCHCDYGQHVDSMCLLASISFEHYILTTILCCLLLLIVLSYCTLLWQPERIRQLFNRNNRSYGTELRNIRRARTQMGRKTPAYTFTVLFNSEDGDNFNDSQSEDILVGDEQSDLANGADAIEMVRLSAVNSVLSTNSPNEEHSSDVSSNVNQMLPTPISSELNSKENLSNVSKSTISTTVDETNPSSSSLSLTPVINSSNTTSFPFHDGFVENSCSETML